MKGSGFDLIMRAIDVALDRRKLLMVIGGLAAAVVPAIVCLWLGGQAARSSGVVSLVLTLLGLGLGWAISSVFMGAVTRMAYDQLEGRPVPAAGVALSAAARQLPALLLSPFALGAVCLVVLLAELVVAQVGRLQGVGELAMALLLLPLVLVNLALLVVMIGSNWLLYPIIIGRNAGPVESLKLLFQVMRQAPGRILAYLGLSALISALFVLVVMALIGAAYSLTLTLIMTGTPALMLSNPLLMLLPIPGMGMGYLYGGYAAPSALSQLAALLAAAETALLFAVAAYATPLSFNLAAGCAVYLAVSGSPASQALAAVPTPPGTPPAPAVPPPTAGWTPPAAQPPVASGGNIRVCVACGRVIPNLTSRFCPSCGAQQP